MSLTANARLSTLEAIEQRRSVKHYDPTFKITQPEIEKIAKLVALTPTAFNIQHFRLVAVTDPAQKAKLQEAAYGQQQVSECSVLFVIATDIKAWSKNPARYWRNMPQSVQNGMAEAITGAYRGRAQSERDEAVLSAGMASQTLMLAAKSLGYDSCPMRGMDFDKVAKLVKLPEDHALCMIIAVGKAAEPPHPRSGPLPLEEILHQNSF